MCFLFCRFHHVCVTLALLPFDVEIEYLVATRSTAGFFRLY